MADFLSNLILGGLQEGQRRRQTREEEESKTRTFAVEQLLKRKFPSAGDLATLAILRQLGLNIPGFQTGETTTPSQDSQGTTGSTQGLGGLGLSSFGKGGLHFTRPKPRAIPALDRRRLEDLNDQLLTVQSGKHPFKSFALPRLNDLLTQKSTILNRLKQGGFDTTEFEDFHTDPQTDPVVDSGTRRSTGARVHKTLSGRIIEVPQDATP